MSASERPAPATGTGPSEIVAAKLGLTVDSRAVGHSSARTSVVVPLPLSWARQLIANGGDCFPEYGSPEWVSLDDRDPRKVAACVQAAECWRIRHQAPEVLPTGSRRLREIADARRPRAGDYKGGSVRWDEAADA